MVLKSSIMHYLFTFSITKITKQDQNKYQIISNNKFISLYYSVIKNLHVFYITMLFK